jgi:hypothetical protein
VNKKIRFSLMVFFLGIFFLVALKQVNAAVPSQCSTGSCIGGDQNDCANDFAAVTGQCNQFFSGACTDMDAYLTALKNYCISKNQAALVGGNCDKITAGGYYGDCAFRMADYAEHHQSPADDGDGSDDELDGSGIYIPDDTGLPDPEGGVATVLKKLLAWLLGIVGVIALISFVIAGIMYLISTGDEDMIERAKRNMTWSILGVIVALAGFVILKAVDLLLRGASF